MRKRVVYIHHGSAHGGAPASLATLIRGLDSTRYESLVLCGNDHPDVVNYFLQQGIAAAGCAMQGFSHTTGGGYALLSPGGWAQLWRWWRQYPAAQRRLAEQLSELQPDIVHLNSLVLAPYARVARQLGIPVVIHIREAVLAGISGRRRAWLRTLLRRDANRVICICRDNQERIGLLDSETEMIWNPVDCTKFDAGLDTATARQTLGISPNIPVTLFGSGSDARIKGSDAFLTAMGQVRQSAPNLLCLMPGFQHTALPTEHFRPWRRRVARALGYYRNNERTERIITVGGLSEHIVCRAFTSDIERWIAASDVVCVPHIVPHFSRTILEAGAMRKPVIAFRIGGVTEAVEHERTGLLVPLGDVVGLADATVRLLHDPELCAYLGDGGYHQTRQLADMRNYAARIEAIYHELCH